jgi:hypothetical protein
MLICMKATTQELADLRARISAARSETTLNNEEIGTKSGVHPSQVSRIVRGEFKTLSHNVVQVCKVLGLKFETVRRPATRADASWSRLERSVRRLWDNSPNGAARLTTLLNTIADLKDE